MSFSSFDAIFNGLSVTDLYQQGNYPRKNNAKMTQWKLYIIHAGRRNIICTVRRLSLIITHKIDDAHRIRI